MRVPSSSRVLAFGLVLAVTGCVGPFASRSGPQSSDSTTARGAAGGEASDSPARAIDAGAPSEPDCDEGVAAAAGAGSADEGADAEPTTLDDGFELPEQAATPGGASGPAPFAELTDAEINARLRADIGALGPMSIGRAHGGVLVAGVRMPAGENWELMAPGRAWGTQETVDALSHAIDAVAARFPDTPKVFIGDVSGRYGGHFPPHVSHQSGRDVDISYYLTEGHRWYATANGSNLDRARTWHLIRTLIAESDVDLILVDTSLQRILKAHALEIGEDPAWLDQIFQVGGKSQRPLIFHAKGHASHLHVRFYSPRAQELGRRAYRLLLARRLVAAPTQYITHTVKRGETLSHLALRYKVTGEAIKKANALKKDVLRVNKPIKIPQTGGIAVPARLVLPARRVPPSPVAVAGTKPASGGAPCRRTTVP
ncbi:MAG: hypothetical protein BGO98_47610 [Myxococcales bacterium 68-20]|nr:MAG: hypothetical protein BGO98_47610 [Myxococcales bacterium 68-20]